MALKNQLTLKEKKIEHLNQVNQSLLTNKNYHQEEKTKLIDFWVEIILKQYAERLEKLMKSYAQEHQKVLELNTSYFNTLSHGLKSSLIVEYYGSIQDLKEEVFLKFEEQKQEHSQKVYNKVLEEFKKYQALQEKLQNQQQNKIKKGRRL